VTAFRLTALPALLRDAGTGAPAADLVGWPRDLFWDRLTQVSQETAAGGALLSRFVQGLDAQAEKSNVRSDRC
jgi:hypothetical protein